jgi:hypothetical protein
MSEWHPVGTDGWGLHGNNGEYYKITPIEQPNNPSEVYRLVIEADDDTGTVTELGTFEDHGSAKLHAERDLAEKFVSPGEFDSAEFMDESD